MVALVDGVPRTLNLVTALQGYIRHQVEVITRRTEFRLDKAKRAHLLEGASRRSTSSIRSSPSSGRARTPRRPRRR
jgi:DNA gyrase/topoisomerase IV subunit A